MTMLLRAQNVRRDFVAGVLSEEELGQTLHCHLLAREYAACASTLRAYDAISRDVLQVLDSWGRPQGPHRSWTGACMHADQCPFSRVAHCLSEVFRLLKPIRAPEEHLLQAALNCWQQRMIVSASDEH